MSVVLSEHLPLLATAPDGIQKLRGLILELAVRGKLVPQDRNDEPASELLKRIAKERARLEAAGSLKKSKAMPVVGEEEKLFDTPIGWEWARLATIGNIFNGNSINSNEKEAKFRRKNGLPYIATKDVGYGLTPLDYDNGICIPESEPNFKIAHEGAVFICAEGGSAGKKCGITDRNVFFGNKLFANETFAGIPPRLVLFLYLSPFFREQFVAAMTGIIGGVSIAKFIEIAIPIPPLAEQNRIVTKVDELMALCDRLGAEQSDAVAAHERLVATLLGTLTQSPDAADLAANWQRLAGHFDTLFTTEPSLDALKQTILQLAVMGKLVPQDPKDEPASELLRRIAEEKEQLVSRGELRKVSTANHSLCDRYESLPVGWLCTDIGSVAYVVTDGTHKTPKYCSSGIKFVSAKDIRSGHLSFNDCKYISREEHADLMRRCKPELGDILVSKSGSIGTVVSVDVQEEFSLFESLALVKFSNTQINGNYLVLAIRNACNTLQEGDVKGVAVKHLHLNVIRSLNLALPPLAEQHRIVAKVDELMTLVDRLKADLAEARAQQERLAATLIETSLKAA